MPGVYTVRLKANGKVYMQQLTVRMDPRVKTPLAALQQQHDLALQAYHGREQAMASMEKAHALRAKVAGNAALEAQLAALEGSGGRRGRGGAAPAGNGVHSFSQLANDFAGIFGILEEADMPPTEQTISDLQTTIKAAAATNAAWQQLQKQVQ
ncbi:hypothetical protein ACQ86N_14730 [Puia sp. P3]|uniref:hypothetical protein n=1 Tax=Puia sp. P3 TaxID=3423952 RepID=UPI003D6721BE